MIKDAVRIVTMSVKHLGTVALVMVIISYKYYWYDIRLVTRPFVLLKMRTLCPIVDKNNLLAQLRVACAAGGRSAEKLRFPGGHRAYGETRKAVHACAPARVHMWGRLR